MTKEEIKVYAEQWLATIDEFLTEELELETGSYKYEQLHNEIRGAFAFGNLLGSRGNTFCIDEADDTGEYNLMRQLVITEKETA